MSKRAAAVSAVDSIARFKFNLLKRHSKEEPVGTATATATATAAGGATATAVQLKEGGEGGGGSRGGVEASSLVGSTSDQKKGTYSVDLLNTINNINEDRRRKRELDDEIDRENVLKKLNATTQPIGTDHQNNKKDTNTRKKDTNTKKTVDRSFNLSESKTVRKEEGENNDDIEDVGNVGGSSFLEDKVNIVEKKSTTTYSHITTAKPNGIPPADKFKKQKGRKEPPQQKKSGIFVRAKYSELLSNDVKWKDTDTDTDYDFNKSRSLALKQLEKSKGEPLSDNLTKDQSSSRKHSDYFKQIKEDLKQLSISHPNSTPTNQCLLPSTVTKTITAIVEEFYLGFQLSTEICNLNDHSSKYHKHIFYKLDELQRLTSR